MEPTPKKDVMQSSFEKETTPREKDKAEARTHAGRRSILGAPVDPNSPTTEPTFPPGLKPEDAKDPGRATPGAPPVENRSGDTRPRDERDR